LGIIRLVLIGDEVIGGVVAPITPGETIYYWYVEGLDQQYKYNYPSVMAVWSLIGYRLQNNIKQLDFMGIGKLPRI
jgi:lipid II:glycine glycyltransferase (peptidoglycan interpeptide bridge formation enzyme)